MCLNNGIVMVLILIKIKFKTVMVNIKTNSHLLTLKQLNTKMTMTYYVGNPGPGTSRSRIICVKTNMAIWFQRRRG